MVAWVVRIVGKRGAWYFRMGRGTAQGSVGRWNQDVNTAKVYWSEGSARRVATSLAPGVAEAVEVRIELSRGEKYIQLKEE